MALNINGTTGISGVDGSVSAPAVTGTDSNTGITFPSADTIKFSTGGVERLSITNSGLSGDGSGLTGISSTSATCTPKVGSSSNVYQIVASNLTYNSVTGDQTLGAVSNCNASSVYGIEANVQINHLSSSASHLYLTAWLYQTGKTYNVDGVQFEFSTYNKYVLRTNQYFILPWDPSGSQSLSLYITSSLETGSNNYTNIEVGNKLENV